MAKKIIVFALCTSLLCGCSNVMWGTGSGKADHMDTSVGSSMVYTDSERDNFLKDFYQLLYAFTYYNDDGEYKMELRDENDETIEVITLEEYNNRMKDMLSTWEKADMYYTEEYLDTGEIKNDIYYKKDYDLIVSYSEKKPNRYYKALINDTGRIAKGYEQFIEDMRSSTDLLYNDCNAGGKYTRLDFSNKEYTFLRDFPYHYNSGITFHLNHMPVRISLHFDDDKPVKAYISYMKVKDFDNKLDDETKAELITALEKAGFENSAAIVNEAAKTVESNEVSASVGKYNLKYLDTSEAPGYWKEDCIIGKGVIIISP